MVDVRSEIGIAAQFLGRCLAYTYEVIELVPGERFVMKTAEGPFATETTYSWQDAGDGATTMTLRNRGEPAGFAKVTAPAMTGAIRRANRNDLRRLKEILERPAPPIAPMRNHGDRELWRWRPDRENRSAQNVGKVVEIVRDTARRVGDSIGAGETTLVLGGDCTVGIGTVAGHVSAAERVGLIIKRYEPSIDCSRRRALPASRSPSCCGTGSPRTAGRARRTGRRSTTTR
jgi:hypothetical protein